MATLQQEFPRRFNTTEQSGDSRNKNIFKKVFAFLVTFGLSVTAALGLADAASRGSVDDDALNSEPVPARVQPEAVSVPSLVDLIPAPGARETYDPNLVIAEDSSTEFRPAAARAPEPAPTLDQLEDASENPLADLIPAPGAPGTPDPNK